MSGSVQPFSPSVVTRVEVRELSPNQWTRFVKAATGLTFADGEAEVPDKATADALRALPAELGVRAIGGRPSKRSNETTSVPPLLATSS